MYGVHLTYHLKSADAVDRLAERLRGLEQTAGFGALSLTRSNADDRLLFALVVWQTEADLDAAIGHLAAGEGEVDRVTSAFIDVVQPSLPGMIGTHVVYTTKLGQEQPFLDWKTHEGEAQRAAPGFIKRSMARSIARPNVFYYLTYWESVSAIDTFVASPAFADSKDRTNVDAAFDHYTPIRVSELHATGGL